jgi:hypothetical protein
MVDIFALALSHGLILLALWRIINRNDLDGDLPASAPESGEGPGAHA